MEQIQKRLEKFKQKQKGFTLVELIVVIAIIGILAGVMLPKYFGFTDDARKASTLSAAKGIKTLMEVYYAENDGKYPVYTDATEITQNGNVSKFNGKITTTDTKGSFKFVDSNGWTATFDATAETMDVEKTT